MMELQPLETRLSEIHGMNRGIVEQGSGRSLNPPLTGKGSIEGRKRKLTKEEKGKQLVGPACQGPSIEDLFSHSYSPPLVFSSNPSSRWVWVTAARVWDPEAHHFSASVAEVRRFGSQAKHLRRVHPATTDDRSFLEVAKKKMDKRGMPFRDGREGDRARDF